MPVSLPQSLLVIRPSALGDVCKTVPVLASIRASWPDVRIGWLVQEEFAAVIAGHPSLDEVVTFPRTRLRGAWRSPRRASAALAWLRTLRKGDWEIAVDCQGLARSGLFARASGAKRRIGFSDAREWGWIHCNERVLPGERHSVDRMMALVDALGIPRVMDMRLYASDEEIAWWSKSELRPDGRYAVFAPMSRWPAKEWPQERWVELVLEVGGLGFDGVVLVGSPSESASVEAIARAVDARGAADSDGRKPVVRVAAGKTNVAQLMAIIAESALVVANDSAALHMAVGFDRPLVGLFGPTDPAEVGPYARADSVVRVPGARGSGHDYRSGTDSHESMRSIDVGTVLERITTVTGAGT